MLMLNTVVGVCYLTAKGKIVDKAALRIIFLRYGIKLGIAMLAEKFFKNKPELTAHKPRELKSCSRR